MQPFRKHVAIAIDGGGLRGIIATHVLAVLEDALKTPVHDLFHLAVGTSIGAIISAGIAAGISAARMNQLYLEAGASIFPNSLRKAVFTLTRYRYSIEPFTSILAAYFGNTKMGELWTLQSQRDLVTTTYDLV